MKLTTGERLKDLRTNAKLTGEQLCNELEKKYGYVITKSKYSEIENDKSKDFGYQSFLYLAKFYDVSIDYLLGLSEVPCVNDKLRATCEYTGLDFFVAHQMNSSMQMNEPIAEALIFLDKNTGLLTVSRQINQCQKLIDEIVKLEISLKNKYPQIRTNDNGDIIVDLNNQDEIQIANDCDFRKIGTLEEELSFSTYKLEQSITKSVISYKIKRRNNDG